MNPYRMLLLSRVCFAPEGVPAVEPPAAPPAPPVPSADPQDEPITVSYANRLRREAANERTAREAAERERDAITRERDEARAAADARVAEVSTAADRRLIRAEARAEAARAGMIDLDGVALLDLSAAKVDPETGEVSGVAEAVAEAKEARKWLFGTPGTTGSTQQPPKPSTDPKDARTMTREEFEAERRRVTGKR